MDPVVTNHFLSIPPYVSTSWEQIETMRVVTNNRGEQELLVNLRNGEKISIPNPSNDLIFKAFQHHASSLNQEPKSPSKTTSSTSTDIPPPLHSPFLTSILGNSSFEEQGGTGVKIGAGFLDNLGGALSHNEEQRNLPDLPRDLLDKVAAVSKMLAQDEDLPSPDYKENCNCMHCQIARAVHKGFGANEELIEDDEPVTEEDLRFREWDIEQKDEHLFKVSNPISPDEVYSVYLGDPLGCTCGKKHCEHIKAVLNS